jgi:hypothetical protein
MSINKLTFNNSPSQSSSTLMLTQSSQFKWEDHILSLKFKLNLMFRSEVEFMTALLEPKQLRAQLRPK